MKITDITTTPLKTGKSLVRIQTDAGVEGWDEGPGVNKIVPGRTASVFEAYLESIIKPTLIGENPLDIDRHWETLAQGKEDRLYKLPANIVGIIDVALWDLLGKETGKPVYTLMGGAARTTIPLYWSTGSQSCRTVRKPESTRWHHSTPTPQSKTPYDRTSSQPNSQAPSTKLPNSTAKESYQKQEKCTSPTAPAWESN